MTGNGSESGRVVSDEANRPGDRDRATLPEDASRTPAENAQLALLLEVAGTPKPGNVDRARDLEDLRFEHFLAGAIGAGEGLRRAERGARVGVAFERAVAGMSRQSGGNTQFGCLLLLVPLVSAAARERLTADGLERIVADTTVADAVAFYRAFEHVDVAVRDPPADLDALDVRRGSAAASTLRDRGLTLADVLALSTETDSDDRIPDWNAVEWTTGFERTFAVADSIRNGTGPVGDRVARAFIDLLADRPDSLVATAHGPAVAREVSERAAAVRGDPEAANELADALVEENINPGTTADTVAAGIFVALERGLSV
ncbi:triphosphoribosyl-dephospho-CoA synthase [Halopenitus persicus]|uniref:Triphosphoribosyl-dephospho-CoA synthase n=1 Tax=Halopenitus persicus TaxID=1048396 RepID=A0A1H3DNQ1_9EURY|nr:triphosphoribosyl-dephospho-CoA synthase [Halopenitus persicus]SDX68045.1 triphosphoribosyl-dephospho-CoA synthase [Halopenitus persicus]